jgi:hypothetical protein
MRDGSEIIDDGVPRAAQLSSNQRRADDPGIVGKPDQVWLDRASDSHGDRIGQRATLALGKIFPRGLETGVIISVERFRFIQRYRAISRNVRQRKARVRAANIDGYDLCGTRSHA